MVSSAYTVHWEQRRLWDLMWNSLTSKPVPQAHHCVWPLAAPPAQSGAHVCHDAPGWQADALDHPLCFCRLCQDCLGKVQKHVVRQGAAPFG